MKRIILLAAVFSTANFLIAQTSSSGAVHKGIEHLSRMAEKWDLSPADHAQMRVTDSYTSQHNGVTHVYYVQQHDGVDIAGATYNVNIQNGEVLSAYHRMVPDFEARISDGAAVQITAEQAVSNTFNHMGVALRSALEVKENKGTHAKIFDKGVHSHMDMPTNLVYAELADGTYTLAWDIIAEPVGTTDMVNVKVDARSGKIISEQSLNVECHFPENFLAAESCDNADHVHHSNEASMTTASPVVDGAQYNALPVRFESPNHGPRELIVNPADPVASPFGWHDQDGIEGSEQTTTFGNNVHAFLDRDGDFQDNEVAVDGGQDLIFDFPYDPTQEPEDYQEASVTNLFYMNNVMHDFAYYYGFDEFSGNFQFTNYDLVGVGGDEVAAHAQFGVDTPDPPLNNAVFGTPPDGSSGRMRMYVWTSQGDNELLRVDEPAELRGTYPTATTYATLADVEWGDSITSTPLTGEVVLANDGSGVSSLGCNAFVNAAEMEGKIAFIDRGQCEFGRKALNAQNAGAIGFIICNFEEGLVTMAAGAVGAQVNIPGVFLGNSDCERLRTFIGDGLTVSFVDETETTGPQARAGSFDNGVIAHEYGHGISNRLTNGPSITGCLGNYDHDGDGTNEDGEQMGEGWSDFFTLVTSVKPGDTGDKVRGIGTYATNQDTNGIGIRPFPYSTDMNINPLTYDDIAFYSVPHGVGTVWCSMLWDLYWALSEEYGWDPDLYTGTGGNNLAIQLVMDGMKFQPCQPSFADGRDAILQADMALTGGENQALIWEVFARRGLGFSAKAGDEAFRLDGNEAFDVDPRSVKSVKLNKSMTPYISAGDTIEVIIDIHNHKEEAVTGIVVRDMIPEGATVIAGSGSMAFTESADMVEFEVESVGADDSLQITYQLRSSDQLVSERFFFDDMEEGGLNWASVNDDGTEIWQLIDFEVNSGELAWGIANTETVSDASLITIDRFEITGDFPVLHFQHRYDTEPFFDAGIFQVTRDNGLTWETVNDDRMIRNGYVGKVPFQLFAFQRLRAWHGSNDGWQQTFVDLRDYAGETVQFRWRFGSDDNTGAIGWFIDDVELMDAYNYNSEVFLTSAEGDELSAAAPEEGTIVESGIVSSSEDPLTISASVRVYPNPASDVLTVEIKEEHGTNRRIEVISSTGSIVRNQFVETSGVYRQSMDVSDLAPGIYLVKVTSDLGQEVVKVFIN